MTNERHVARITLCGLDEQDEQGQAFEGDDIHDVIERVLSADVSSIQHPIMKVCSGLAAFVEADTDGWADRSRTGTLR